MSTRHDTGSDRSAAPLPCDGRYVELPRGDYDWLRVELDTDAPGTETVWLYYEDAAEPEYLHVGAAGTGPARIAVPRRSNLVGLRLPERPDMKVLSLEPVPSARRTEWSGT
ncbi:hypothetical protein [Nocardiopsis sp. FIRDI 009]|uniref:hypothetical protein n=1 Tax=Nocardiopsis sp. FIRDI 009 TaxID=714197 RepID=UPI0013002BDA|nr:hypothetical protein [Nocardiopsis sp. FIRDI 009]